MADWSPGEALPKFTAAARTPLTLVEGIHWLLQQPEALARSHCFMTIGSRLRRARRHIGPTNPGPLDQQRDRKRRQQQTQRAQGGLVLGWQPTHLAWFRIRSPAIPTQLTPKPRTAELRES